MYYQNYEDYMRSILGYPLQEQRIYETTYTDYSNMNNEYPVQLPKYSNQIMELYPEIYKIVNPMVCKMCEANTKPICRELIEQMTDEIYLNLESDPSEYVGDVVNVQVNLPKTMTSSEENRKSLTKDIKSNNVSSNKSIKDCRYEARRNETNKIDLNKGKNEKTFSNESRVGDSDVSQVVENRQFRRRNNILRDLIKILILNRLLGGEMRPPRPPFPGGPGFLGQQPRPPRPPFPESGPNFPTHSFPSFPR